MKLLSLVDKKKEVEAGKWDSVFEQIQKFFLVEEVDEIVLLAKCKNGSLRSNGFYHKMSNKIWWMGALEVTKNELGCIVNDDVYELEDDGKKPEGEGGNGDE